MDTIVFGIRTYQRPLSEFKHFPIEDSIALIDAIQNTGKDNPFIQLQKPKL